MRRKSLPLPIILAAFFLAGCISKAAPVPTLSQPPDPTSTPIPTPTPFPAELDAWLDEAIDPDLLGEGQNVVIHFSHPMDPQSASAPLIVSPRLRGDFSWSEDFLTLTFTPTGRMNPNVQYQVSVARTLASAEGETFLHPPGWSIRRETPPRIVSRLPAGMELPLENPSFSLTFSHDMDPASVEAALTVEPHIPLAFRWEKKTLEVALAANFSPGQKFTFTLADTATTAAGEALDSSTWTYRTSSIAVQFSRGERPSRLAPFTFAFNYPMDTASVEKALLVNPPFQFDTIWDAQKKILTITPLEPVQTGGLLTFTLETGARAQSASGGLLEPQHWTYNPPALVAAFKTTPGEDRRPELILQTNVALDPASAVAALWVEPAFAYDASWSKGNTQLTIVPREPLPSLTNFTLRFEDTVNDADSYPVGGLGVYRFRTPSPIANEPPIGSAFDPWTYGYNGPRPVKPEDDFLIVFDRPMDPDSTLEALTIMPAIPGDSAWLDARRLQILPAAGHLEEFTEYRLTLAPTALDAEGTPVLSEAYTWIVPTGGLPNRASFGDYGANVQVVDLDGRRAIQIAAVRDLQTLQLELYRLTIAQFINFQANSYVAPWAGGRAQQPFDLSGAALAGSWSAEVIYGSAIGKNQHAAEIILPEGLDEGLYVINLHTDHLDDQLLLVASRSAIAVKYGTRPEGGGPLLAWVSNINGYVMRAVDVRVYDRQGAQIASGITDSIGVFKTYLREGTEPYLIAARQAGGITVAGVGEAWKTRWWGGYHQEAAGRYFAYLYTDRPIYRPGQRVNYKGIVRLEDDVDFSLPPEELSAALNVRDARNNVIVELPVALNEFGTFNGSFEIAAGAMLGSYSLELVIGEESHRQSFKVQDYKKPDIAVSVSTDRDEYIVGDTIAVTVEADYLFGEPVANASLKVNTYELLPIYRYWWGNDPLSGPEEYDWIPSRNALKTLVTDENGRATFTLPAKIGQAARDHYYYEALPEITEWGLELTADDGSNQEISAHTIVRVHSYAVEAQLELSGWAYSPDAPIPLTVRLASQFGDPVAGRALSLDVQRYDYSASDYVSTEEHALTTDEAGLAHLELALDSGSYKLALAGKDGRGNLFKEERWLYVHGFTNTGFLDSTIELSLKAEDRDYAPGETAQIIVESSFSGEGLLTIERGGILEQRMVKLQAPFTPINVPIKAEYAPNVYIVVQAWRPQPTDLNRYEWAYESVPDSLLRWGAVELRVPDANHALNVEILPDKASYAPGEEAGFTLHVTDSRENPVRAEVSLALVDEAIFLLANDPAGDIHEAFYAPRSLGLSYYDSLAPWRYLWFDEGGYGGGGGGEFPSAPRGDFPDTALWMPSVVTDARGEATLALTLPDTLTSWRLTAKAVTQNTLIGEGQVNVLTQQSVVVRPLPPRNLIAGDRFMLSALVHNFSQDLLAVEVTALGEGIDLGTGKPQQIQLRPGAARVVTWAGAAGAPGEAAFTITASSPEGNGDSVRMPIQIQALMIPVNSSQSGQFSGETSLFVSPESGALPESQVRLTVNATIASSLLNGVEYLTGYPYGCVEQTMSRALPNAVVARAFEHLGLGERADPLGLGDKLAASVQRLYAFQHDDGGWGWWYDDPSDGYQTAWVVFGLAVTAESGYPVEDSVLARGVDFLRWNLDYMNASTRAFALYAMTAAGQGGVELAFEISGSLSELDSFSRAALALTFHELGEIELADQLLDQLLAEVIVEPNGGVHAPGKNEDGYYDRKFMSSRIRSTAMILRAVMAIRPESELRPGLVQWLQGQRRPSGWGTTNETAFTLLALTDHLLAQQHEAQDANVSVYLNNTPLITGTLTAENLTVEVEIPVSDLAPGENEIRLTTDAGQPLYYMLVSDMFLGQAQIAGEGLDVTREYLDPESKLPLKQIVEGELVLVRLSVEAPQTAFYAMLIDHLPGGLEALNEGLNITGHDVAAIERGYYDDGWDPFHYDDYGYNQKEIRSDQVIFFITELHPGKATFKYYARATVAGTFTALPAEFSAMYDETVWGRSGSEVLVIHGAAEET